MLWLIVASLLWALSFGLIKQNLTTLDPVGVAVTRLMLALLVFLPFLRLSRIKAGRFGWLLAIGAVQFGLMYAFYLASFAHLKAYEVGLFTAFTPIYVTSIDALLMRRLEWRHAGAALLSIAGAWVVLWNYSPGSGVLRGFALVQLANLCFASGQVAYRRLRPLWSEETDACLHAQLLTGALISTGLISLGLTDWSAFSPTYRQGWIIVYLGILASGVGFYLWNRGVTQVNVGTLAVFNNLKIPLAVVCSLIVFGEEANLLRVAASFVLIAAGVIMTHRPVRANPKTPQSAGVQDS